MRHLPTLDGLRAIAIGLVLWQHAGILFRGSGLDGEHWFWRGSSAGWLGVDLFFVLSGLLITRALLRHDGSASALWSFWKRRAARTLPLLYVYLVVVAAYGFGGAFSVRDQPWLSYVSHTANLHIARHDFGLPLFGMLWSLGVEEQFYVFWPLLVRWVEPRLGRACVALFLLAPVARYVVYHRSDVYAAFHVLPFCRVDTLALGAGIALCIDDEARWARLVQIARWAFVPAVALLLGVIRLSLGPWTLLDYHRELAWVVPGYSLVALACAVVVVVAAAGGAVLTPVLGNPVIGYVGKISYGIYLWHCLLAMLVVSQGGGVDVSAKLLVWLVLVLLVASASWFGVERPWLVRPRPALA